MTTKRKYKVVSHKRGASANKLAISKANRAEILKLAQKKGISSSIIDRALNDKGLMSVLNSAGPHAFLKRASKGQSKMKKLAKVTAQAESKVKFRDMKRSALSLAKMFADDASTQIGNKYSASVFSTLAPLARARMRSLKLAAKLPA